MTRRLKQIAAVAAAAFVLAAAPAQCSGSNAGSNPFGKCPAGTHRVRVVTNDPQHQWVCA